VENLKLKNALVIALLEQEDDHFSIEINLTELLSNAGIKAIPSLNILKRGNYTTVLATDSIQELTRTMGVDTYMLVSVRGYDKKFKPSSCKDDLQQALSVGNLFPIYRDEIVSVSFEFTFYRNGQCVGSDIVKCGNVSDRESVLKKFRKQITKKITNDWL
jgi:Cft2 family RNA processing exonuclease